MIEAPRDIQHPQSGNARWYVVQTKPFAENRAITHLERQGYRIFCPRYRKTIRHARKKKSVLAPLFPNYLFLQMDPTHDRWRSVNGTRGVARLLTHGDSPQPVPHGVIEALQAQSDIDGVIDWAPSFRIGQMIQVMEGPFTDFIGRLERLDSAGRVRVLLDLLGRPVPVNLRREAIISAA
jgi:transcriptional antiterminator RfaH